MAVNMKFIKYFFRFLVGGLFLFSGVVKGIDPMGIVYKFQDYFNAFHLDFLSPAALVFAIALSLLEFVVGVSILFKQYYRAGVFTATVLMTIFTPFTLMLAIFNPVSDCGCFGDAIKLTNWQTFFKNLIFIIPTLSLFSQVVKEKSSALSNGRCLSVLMGAAIFFVLFAIFNLRYLPILDFLPYKIGTNIPEGMTIPENAEPDRYETTFIYEKEGVRQEFSIDNYPADDTLWNFVEAKSRLISKGYTPPIHDFYMLSSEGNDVTADILSSKNYTLLLLSKRIEEAKKGYLEKMIAIKDVAQAAGVDFYLVTASSDNEAAIWANDNYLLMDETVIKTMIRTNPGIMLLKEGTILGKWSWAHNIDINTINNIINN